MTILFFISHTILQFLHAIIHVIILTFSQILHGLTLTSLFYYSVSPSVITMSLHISINQQLF